MNVSARLLCAAAAVSLVSLALASEVANFYVPIRTVSGLPIVWKALPVTYIINESGSQNIPNDDSESLAIRLAFETWEDLPGSKIKFVENKSASAKKIDDWHSLTSHIVFFDEDGDPDLLPTGAGIVAITPIRYDSSNGKILDADIILNANEFFFSTTLDPGTFDVFGTVLHEAGHFIGLDHSGIVGATMWPFEVPQEFKMRSLAADDIAGAEASYPNTNKATIAGAVRRSSTNAGVAGANVWARSTVDGRVFSATISDSIGHYLLQELDPGSYRVVAAPLDGPMSSLNLIGGGSAMTDFQPGSTTPIVIVGNEQAAAPDLLVGNDAAINITAPSTGRTIHPGESIAITLAGTAIVGTTVSIPDSGLAFSIAGPAPSFMVTASVGALPGLYDIFVTNGLLQTADYAGGLEVLPLAPSLAAVTPAVGSIGGGTTVVLDGSNFSGAPRVIFGDVEGQNIVVVSPTRITVTAPAHAAATIDVSLVSDSGEESTMIGAFEFAPGTLPGPASIFPNSGSSLGGTAVSIVGNGFQAGATIAFDGAAATGVTFVSSTELHAITPALATGSHDVAVTNPGSPGLVGTILGGFTSAISADPTISSVTPPVIDSAGGEALTIVGNGFDPAATVTLGASPSTGLGGLPAAVDSANPNQIDATTPSDLTKTKGYYGDVPVLVRNPGGQVAIATGVLRYAPNLSKVGNLTGSIGAPGEVDVIFVDTIAGATLSVTANAPGKSLLEPQIVVKDPNDVVIATVGAPGVKKAVLAGLVAALTGRHRIEISGIGGTSGGYKLTFKEALPKSQTNIKIPTKPPTAVGPQTADFTFLAKKGSLLKGTISAKGGLKELVAALDGPSGSILGDPDVAAKIVVSATGTTIQLKGVPLKELGSYTLKIGPAMATVGTITGSLTISPPKAITNFTEK